MILSRSGLVLRLVEKVEGVEVGLAAVESAQKSAGKGLVGVGELGDVPKKGGG